MSVPAEKLTSAFETVQENLEAQVKLHKRMTEITESQLESANGIIKEMEGMSAIQNELIENLTAMNDRYEVLLRERDEFISSLRVI